MRVFEQLGNNRVIPVIVVEDADHAVPMAEALVEGGVAALEVTLRTPVAGSTSWTGAMGTRTWAVRAEARRAARAVVRTVSCMFRILLGHGRAPNAPVGSDG